MTYVTVPKPTGKAGLGRSKTSFRRRPHPQHSLDDHHTLHAVGFMQRTDVGRCPELR